MGVYFEDNFCISEITIHKDGAKYRFFVSHGSIRMYCLVTTSIQMFYGKLFRNKRNSQGPPKMRRFQSRYTEYIHATKSVLGRVPITPVCYMVLRLCCAMEHVVDTRQML